MRKLTLTILTFCFGLAAIAPAFANCPRCIEARKNNEKNKSKYVYYEDYLNNQNKSN